MCVDNAEDGIQAIGTSDAPVPVDNETEAQDRSEAEDSKACLHREILALEMRDFDEEEGIDSDPEEDKWSHVVVDKALWRWIATGTETIEQMLGRCFLSGKKGRFARISSLFAARKTSPPTSLGGQRSSDATHSKLHEE
jgi:hypothetical protein